VRHASRESERSRPERKAVPGTWDGHAPEELERAWCVPRVETYRLLGSTNDRAAALGREEGARPAVVLSEEQTAGRGRRGTAWQSAPGVGIWMSVLLGPEARSRQLPLVVGVACARAIERIAQPGLPVSIKWPNDLQLGARKVGGILCESGPYGVVVGIGLNVAPPREGFASGVDTRATTLEAHARKVLQRKSLAGEILRELLEVTSRPDPFGAVRSELARRDALTGRRVDTDGQGPGIARGIDEQGALLLEREDGSLLTVASGSVRLAAGSVAD
jgi:BirA family biotin operon repressor/biotin-[acetyl-CoA-carboxylase] ligase